MSTKATNPLLAKIHSHRAMIFPLACIGMLLVLLVPLPTQLLDLLLIFNITLSVIVLVTTIYLHSPLEFAVFPSLLLAVTLFRLVLNVATTRLILTNADLAGAGEVVKAFSNFVIGDSLAVGVIIFAIIFVIQFVVITKGSTRISEVAARFVLDAMPGKQMSIDADLAAGHLNEQQARERRDEISQQADFYGAMDGASKFVRGDAIATVIITFINICGGLYIGIAEKRMAPFECAELFTRLTIGDGLVSQVPAFIVSLAAGLIVTRASSRSSLGEEMIGQVFAKPRALAVAAIFLLLLAFTGLPTLPLLLMAAGCACAAVLVNRRSQVAPVVVEEPKTETPVEKLLDIETIQIEVGFGLVKLMSELLARVDTIRRSVATELGILIPAVGIRDARLDANDYVIKIKGETIATGVTYAEQFLAIDDGHAEGPIAGGERTADPIHSHKSYWITESQIAEAKSQGYVVIEAIELLAKHLQHVITTHAAELVTRQAVKNLLDALKTRAAALVEEVVPNQVKPGELQKVLQNLLREHVPVRDLETILETLSDYSGRTKDIEVLTEHVRGALSRTICKQFVDDADRLWCVTLDPSVEETIGEHLEHGEDGQINTLPPDVSRDITSAIGAAIADLVEQNHPPVLLCNPSLRLAVRRMIEHTLPHVAVLGFSEIVPTVSIETLGMVQLHDDAHVVSEH